MKSMSMNYKNYIAWQEEVRRRGEVARRLRFALFVLSTVAVAAVVWIGLCHAAPAVLRYEAQEQERLDAEFEAQMDAADAELLREIERGCGK